MRGSCLRGSQEGALAGLDSYQGLVSLHLPTQPPVDWLPRPCVAQSGENRLDPPGLPAWTLAQARDDSVGQRLEIPRDQRLLPGVGVQSWLPGMDVNKFPESGCSLCSSQHGSKEPRGFSDHRSAVRSWIQSAPSRGSYTVAAGCGCTISQSGRSPHPHPLTERLLPHCFSHS